MKHIQLAFLLIFLFSFFGVKAQQNHFIYIETENKQAFYVKLDKKLYISSPWGYLVMPKLKDGQYNLSIGFPKSEGAEQNLVCSINNSDAGYLLKNFENKGWGLFNLQTLAVTMASDSEKAGNVEVVKKTDAFSNMLSTVVNDSTIRQTEIVKTETAEPVKQEETKAPAPTPAPEVAQNSGVVEQNAAKRSESQETQQDAINEVAQQQGEKDPVPVEEGAMPAVKRILFNKNAAGTEMVFTDGANGKTDTVRVFIPAEKTSAPVEKTTLPAEKTVAPLEKNFIEPETKEVSRPGTEKQEPKAKDTRFLEVELPGANKKTGEAKPVLTSGTNNDTGKVEKNDLDDKAGERVTKTTPMINSDCKSVASADDFLKLRKKMAAEDNDDDMITLAKKSFKLRCFTVEQVKNLSVLFLKDAGRYAFFDMAYPFVADSDNFSTLQAQLSDTYYINRFQSMIRH